VHLQYQPINQINPNPNPDPAHLRRLENAPWYDLLCNDGVPRYGSQLTHDLTSEIFAFNENAHQSGQMLKELHFDGYEKDSNRFVANHFLADRYPGARESDES